MPRNEGWIDRGLRIAVGLGLLSLVLVGPRTAWGYLGLIPILTGIAGFYPLYSALGIRTCSGTR